MQLPNATEVLIAEGKVRDYLLSPFHPRGKHKAEYFAALGFSPHNADDFTRELRRIAAEGHVQSARETVFGHQYSVPGSLHGPLRSAAVITVSIRRHGENGARLVTVRPR